MSGNPAGVCILEEKRDSTWMQEIARRLGLSETAFLVRSGNVWNIRWFTPVCEVDLCGHATLASAHLLREQGLCRPESLHFRSRSGPLPVRFTARGIELNFPADPPLELTPPPLLLRALGLKQSAAAAKGLTDYLVLLEDERSVAALLPDFEALAKIDMRGVTVTAPARPPYDFVSRFFAPRAGIPEDPVTGSAHCLLGPFWGRRLGKRKLEARQISSRGGKVKVTLAGERVYLEGQALTVKWNDLE